MISARALIALEQRRERLRRKYAAHVRERDIDDAQTYLTRMWERLTRAIVYLRRRCAR